jgi:SHS2 domain-containing protein
MPYRYLEDVAIADAAFEAWGESLEEVFVSACQATLNIMVGNLSTIRPRQFRHFRVEETQVDMLLFQLLQELIYYKDAEQVLFLVRSVRIRQDENCWSAFVEVAGESIDPQRHDLIVDVKAVTLHNFEVRQTGKGWIATVIIDV